MSAFSPKQNQTLQRTSSDMASGKSPAHSISHHQHPILNLQRTIGNQAVQRRRQSPAEGSEADAAASHQGTPYDFAGLPVFHAPVRGIQRKLTVNAPGDAYEQEADRVSEQVMRMHEPRTAAAHAISAASAGSAADVQRACECGGTCNDCKKKHPEGDHARVQMKAAGTANAGGVEAPPIVHEVLRSPGQPLDPATRAFMEPRFGQDFSGVRVHTDAKAAESARAVNAKAYTAGKNVVFGAGQYGPGTDAGQRLLGHELTHVVQQGESGRFSSSSQLKPGAAPGAMSATPPAMVQRNPQPGQAAGPAAPAWLGRSQANAVHVTGNIWDVNVPSLGGDVWAGPYDELSAYITQQGYGGRMEAAHIVGGEHLNDIQSPFTYDKAPCVAVDRSLHATWTSQTATLQAKYLGGRATATSGRAVVTSKDVAGLYNELYAGHPELREMTRNILSLPKANANVGTPMDAHQGAGMGAYRGTGMPKPQSPMDAHQGTGMPKPQSPMDAHQGTGMPKPQSPMDAHQGTGMPKPQSPMDAHQGTGMPKPQSPMEAHQGTGMPKPQSPMEAPGRMPAASVRGRIGNIATGLAAAGLEALSAYLIAWSVAKFENEQIERWWKAQIPDIEAALERRQQEISKILHDTNYRKTVYGNIHMELQEVMSVFHTRSGSSWRWAVAGLKFTGADVSTENINRDDPSRTDMHIYGGSWYLPFTYSVAIAIPAPLVTPDIQRLHDQLAAIRSGLLAASGQKSAGALVALDQLNLALQATDFSPSSAFQGKTPAERFQITSAALDQSRSVLEGQEEDAAAAARTQLRFAKAYLNSLASRWLAMVEGG
jgi:hypothetical protein